MGKSYLVERGLESAKGAGRNSIEIANYVQILVIYIFLYTVISIYGAWVFGLSGSPGAREPGSSGARDLRELGSSGASSPGASASARASGLGRASSFGNALRLGHAFPASPALGLRWDFGYMKSGFMVIPAAKMDRDVAPVLAAVPPCRAARCQRGGGGKKK